MKSRHERAALFGFFRNCSETLISSDVNREGYAYRAIESAKIDGAGEYTIFFTKSADIQTLSYYMLSITKASASAASLGETMSAGASSVLTTMSNSAANYKTIELACMVLSALPLIIVYPFAQKFFEKGVMVGSVKG